MQRKILISYIIYFLLVTYAYSSLTVPWLGWACLAVPALLMTISLLCAAIMDSRPTAVNAVLAGFVRYDWQKLFVGFAVLAPVAASFNGSPVSAAAASVMSLLFVLITGTTPVLDFPKFVSIAFAACIIGSVLSYQSGTNGFGYLPWQEAANPTFVGVSRVSLFPSVWDSAFFSFIVFITVVRFRPRLWLLTSLLASYFIYFSYSRTIIFIVIIALFSEILSFMRVKSSINFFLSLFVLILSIGYAHEIVPKLVDAEMAVRGGKSFLAERLVRRAVLKDSKGEKIDPELLRLYRKDLAEKNPLLKGRADLWRDHVRAFLSAPLTGVGREKTVLYIRRTSMDSSVTGSESFLTRILAEFGVAAVLFWLAIWRLFVHFDRDRNAFGRALTMGLLVTLSVYGSSALPYNFVFLCYLALMGYVLRREEDSS